MIPRLCAGSLNAALVLALLLPFAPRPAIAQGHGEHGDHGKVAQAQATGDSYCLDVDAVSGKSLGPVDKQAIVVHEGREFRFASQENAAAFKADPAKYIPGVDAKMIAQQAPMYPCETCVVSGSKLGKKDTAVDFVYQNRLVRVASKEDKATFLAEPTKYMAKIDAAVVERQKPKYALATCIVSGEKLEGMDDTVDYVVGNRLVRFCCKSCVKDFNKDPLKYLAALDAAAKDKGGKAPADKSAAYVCPMHTDVVADKPGRCPKCGMDLVKKK